MLAGLLLHLIPQLTRADLFFAVTVAPEFRPTPAARRIMLMFRSIVWISTLAAIALAVVTQMKMLAVILQLAGFLLAFLSARNQALNHTSAQSSAIEIDLAAPPERLPGGLVVALLPPCSLIVLAIWAIFNWERLPERFPVHWSPAGPDRWLNTSPGTVFGLLASNLFLCLMMVAMAWGVLGWSRRIATMGPRAQRERAFRRRGAQLLIIVEYLLPLPAWFALLQAPAKAMIAWVAALALLGAVSFVILIRAGQGGSRKVSAAGAGTTGDRTPDTCWKLGLIYFNPVDPSIFVEKRFGIGYTINFGNRWSWLMLAVMLVPLIITWVFLR